MHVMAQGAGATDVFVFKVKQKTVFDEIEALGTLRANESVDVTANVTEKVSDIYFEDGDFVEKGTLLVSMTSGEEKALLDEARATLSEAKRQYERVKPLVEKKTASEALLDQRQREFKTAQARLAAIESQMDDRIIKAPFTGQLGFREISVGTLVEPSTLITTIDQIDILKLDFDVPSIFLGDLKKGDEIITRTDSLPNRTFKATIDTVGTRVDPETRALRYRALLINNDRILKPGLLMKMDLRTNKRDALMIPESALKPLGPDNFVFVVSKQGDNNFTAMQRQVVIGARKDGMVEVKQGLSTSEHVVVHGVMKIKDGAPINISSVVDAQTNIQSLLKEQAKSKAAQ